MSENSKLNVLAWMAVVAFSSGSLSCTRPASDSPTPSPSADQDVSVYQQSFCTSVLDLQIQDELKLLIKPAKYPDRSGASYLILPKNPDQFKKLNKMAILAVQVTARKKQDLPLNRVLVSVKGKKDSKAEPEIFVLPRIFPKVSINLHPEGSEAAGKLGRFKQTVFLFVPIRLLKSEGELGVVFSDGLKVLPIAKLPIAVDLPYLKSVKDLREDSKTLPDPDMVVELIEKNFCLPSS